MVYKIRNKAFYIPYGVNHPRVDLFKKMRYPNALNGFVTIQVQPTRYTSMRALHNYRNISRAAKQFLMGDVLLEQLVIQIVRFQFFRPSKFKSPIYATPYLGRAMQDLVDRHYSLVSHNQHPLQLMIYKRYAEMINDLTTPEAQERKKAIQDRIAELEGDLEKQLRTDEGETPTYDDYQRIYLQAHDEYRSAHNMSLKTRDRHGRIDDYLEVRRPFGTDQ